MNLADLRTDFLDELLHDECSNEAADRFIAKALRRIQRECRLPCMEAGMIFQATDEAIAYVTIPSDLIAPLEVLVPSNVSSSSGLVLGAEAALLSVSYRALQAYPVEGSPAAYARLTNRFHVRGAVPVGSYLKLVYYASSAGPTADTDETAIMAAAPELILYAALAYAGIVYEKPQVQTWESAFQATKEAVDQQARDLDWGGGPKVISPAYEA